MADRDSQVIVPHARPIWLSRWSRDHLGVDDNDLALLSPRYQAAIITPAGMQWAVQQESLPLNRVVRFSATVNDLRWSHCSRALRQIC